MTGNTYDRAALVAVLLLPVACSILDLSHESQIIDEDMPPASSAEVSTNAAKVAVNKAASGLKGKQTSLYQQEHGLFTQLLQKPPALTKSQVKDAEQRNVFDQTAAPVEPPVLASDKWPNLTTLQIVIIVSLPILCLIVIVIALKCFMPVDKSEGTNEEEKALKSVNAEGQEEGKDEENALKSVNNEEKALKSVKYLPGEVAGDYSTDWKETFDMAFLVGMIVILFGLLLWTGLTIPSLFTNWRFFCYQLAKLAIMVAVSVGGGLLCRLYCDRDEKGYIVTKSSSWFKVNYTRKIQHFCAYAIPLVITFSRPEGMSATLDLCWSDYFTMLGFLIMIKPIRESSSIIMLQFNSLDRPEDRPHNLKWIVAGNIFPGLLMIVAFRNLFATIGEAQTHLVMIFVLVAGVGDGLAEPVGVTWGDHKYEVKSACSDDERTYIRSLEGSACVFVTTMMFVGCYYWCFLTQLQFLIAMVILPPLMTVAEAVSPHTMDTPFLMGLGGTVLFFILKLF